MTTFSNGWDDSARAWMKTIGDDGDYGRKFVLDAPMLARIAGRGFRTALDIGCGEGRFCRMMHKHGIESVGIDPTSAFIARARLLDPEGDYRITTAEALAVPAESIDLVVAYLSLIDIPGLDSAVAAMVSALRPGGTLLIANLNAFHTAATGAGWVSTIDGKDRFSIDHYLTERPMWSEWRGVRIQNWHRPLSTYMALLLSHGLTLRHFAEPEPHGGDKASGVRYRRVPWFYIMEWQKSG